MDRSLSAPGKLFLSGEYAVLWGGVARVLAAGPRTQVTVRPRSDRRVNVVLAAGRLSGVATPLGVAWDAPPSPEFRFVARTVDLALRATGLEGPGFSLAFTPSPLVEGRKLGLGSSARAAVLAAEGARTALGAGFDALKLALVGHADAQGGKGSGGDVAACFAGGVVRYRRYDVGPLLAAASRGGLTVGLFQAPPVELARTSAPRLPLAFGFSGQSAATTSLVQDVELRWRGPARARFVEESDALGDALERGLTRGDFGVAREAAEGLQALLASLGGPRSEGLEQLLALARTFGCAGKQSGAGGGDGAVIVAPDLEARAAFLEACRARSLFAEPLAPEEGLRGEARPPALLAVWLDALVD